MNTHPQICFIVSTPTTAFSFLRDHIAALSEKYDVSLVANFPDEKSIDNAKQMLPQIKEFHHVAIERGISILSDSSALVALTEYFRKKKFDVVHSVTPKAGLLRDIQEIGYAVGWSNGLRLRYSSTRSALAQNIQFSEPIFEKNLACGHE